MAFSPDQQFVHDQVVEELKSIQDPEINANIYDLGLIYNIHPNIDTKVVDILITFTTPACPFADIIINQINANVSSLESVREVNVEVTFDPVWSVENIDEELKIDLGII